MSDTPDSDALLEETERKWNYFRLILPFTYSWVKLAL